MLQEGQLVPHFVVRNVAGERVSYKDIWQHRGLVLVALPADARESSARYEEELAARSPEIAAHRTTLVVTHDAIAGVTPPAVVIADQWGEVIHSAAGNNVADLPAVDELIDWTGYVVRRCPECEGESK